MQDTHSQLEQCVAEKISDVKPSNLYVLHLRKATTGVTNTIKEVINLLREGILFIAMD